MTATKAKQVVSTRPLPKLNELHFDPKRAFDTDEFNRLMYQPAHEDWIRNHPSAKTKNDLGQEVASRYIPIEKIEFLMSVLFGEWYPEILREGVMLNSVYMIVRLHWLHPVTGQWRFFDGCGAKDVQLDKGATPSDLSKIKGPAIMMALPSAKSFAIKDAADHFGPLFGRDLNRRDTLMFYGMYSESPEPMTGNGKREMITQIDDKIEQIKRPLTPPAPPIMPVPTPAASGFIM